MSATQATAATIRLAREADAPRFIAHQQAIVAEATRTAPLEPDEIRSLDDMRAWVAMPITLVAEHAAEPEPELLGTLSLRRPSPRRSFRHVAVLGMSLRASARGQGLGRALLTAAFDHAARDGISRIELLVFASNARAIALYEKLGFAHEGRRRNGARVDGALIDELYMAKLL